MKLFLTTFGPTIATAAIVIGGLFYFQTVIVPEMNPVHQPVVNVTAKAAQYGKDMMNSYGDNAIVAGKSIRAQKSLDDVEKAFGAANKAGMEASFDAHFRSILTAILPESTEPSTAEQRESLARFFEQLGSGVKGVAK